MMTECKTPVMADESKQKKRKKKRSSEVHQSNSSMIKCLSHHILSLFFLSVFLLILSIRQALKNILQKKTFCRCSVKLALFLLETCIWWMWKKTNLLWQSTALSNFSFLLKVSNARDFFQFTYERSLQTASHIPIPNFPISSRADACSEQKKLSYINPKLRDEIGDLISLDPIACSHIPDRLELVDKKTRYIYFSLLSIYW